MERHGKTHRRLMASVITVAFVGAAGIPPDASAATTGSLLVHAVEFQPTTHTTDFDRSDILIGIGQFVARPKIPTGAAATAVEIYYLDALGAADICVTVYEAKPSTGALRQLSAGTVCTSGTVGEMRTLVVPLVRNTIAATEALLVSVQIPERDVGLKVTGARVKYRRP